MTKTNRSSLPFVLLLLFVVAVAGGLLYLYLDGEKQLAASSSSQTPPSPSAPASRQAAPPAAQKTDIMPAPTFAHNATLIKKTPEEVTAPLHNATTSEDGALVPAGAEKNGLLETNSTLPGSSHPVPLTELSSTNATLSIKTNGTKANSNETLVFSTAKPVDKSGTVVSGSAITKIQPAASTTHAGFKDAIVSRLFVTSLAEALASSYWPKGTHPAAKHKAISTFSFKWANMHYGGSLTGFSVAKSPLEKGRHQIFDYVFMPSMVSKLYEAYVDLFMQTIEKTALTLTRGSPSRSLSQTELAEMYAIFTSRTRALAGALQAFTSSPDIPQQLHALFEAENAALEASYQLLEASDSSSGEQIPHASLTKEFQTAIKKRENIYNEIIATMRKSGDTRQLDGDTMIYIASWLNRRGEKARPAIEKIAGCLIDLASRFEAKELLHQEQEINRAEALSETM